MSTITRERLIKIQQWRETYGPDSNVVLPAEEAEELARIALASLEAEPVASCMVEYGGMCIDGFGEYVGHSLPDGSHPLYAAPPAPVSVPTFDEWCQRTGQKPLGWVRDVMKEAYEGCASAMLQGADGNSPVIPGGWVACSERMPNIGVPVITCCGDVVQYAAYAWDGKEWQDWYEEYDKLPANTFTHWHPRPAAPQQEVKP
ncbi:DUF551 domain-containing protein [Enterobacter cloacae]|uniref:DUF551 domain-containing protein n=1 Tax=Enterobacter cloacae TaxID=550 RepID=UPI002FD86477